MIFFRPAEQIALRQFRDSIQSVAVASASKAMLMTDEKKLAYLKRAFEREREDSLLNVQMARQRILREASAAGALQSGRTLLLISGAYTKEIKVVGTKMCRQAFDTTSSNAPDIVSVTEKELKTLRDAISDDLADYFRKAGSWAGDLGQATGNTFLGETDKIIFGLIDDFSHGILEGIRLSKNPEVNFISTITNSPGAVMQAGVGNVQKALSVGGASSIHAAITDFLQSVEVQKLSAEDRQGILDIAEVISAEVDKTTPDAPKLARWGTRLIDLSEKLGISVAAAGITKALFG
jgi:hypothetical protein